VLSVWVKVTVSQDLLSKMLLNLRKKIRGK